MKDVKDTAQKELAFCLDLWAKGGSCSFGGATKCESCGAPYLLYKLCTDEVLHGERLSREDWESLAKDIPQETPA